MTIRGKAQGGVIVPIDPFPFVDGTVVTVSDESKAVAHDISHNASHDAPQDNSPETAGDVFKRFAGRATGLPPDAAANHDHYLYGTPKQQP